ncbi:Gfo/Idh/MocA family oxidoreductase [bacterium]|nr:Gfo/Idh/MocA family oxidoreductase [bacterium]
MIDVLVVGTGEYVTGLSKSGVVGSDKKIGVIGLTLFDLKKRSLIDRVLLSGKNGARFPQIREHFTENIENVYDGIKTNFESFPSDDIVDSKAYIKAIQSLKAKSCVIIFTPDDTHFEIAKAAILSGMHVLIAKPMVKTSKEHQSLMELSKKMGVFCMLEVHKRFDPIYADAVDRSKLLGDFSYMNSYMSQPKSQLDTFKDWAGLSSDISYYLNSHHIDLLSWMLQGKAKPIWVSAIQSTGVASNHLKREMADTISLTVQWQNVKSGNFGMSNHTSSWIAPKSDVHSQQRFHYMGHLGELNVDQAHRGYTSAQDDAHFASENPLFMKYRPRNGKFVGQSAYGYVSIETFIQTAHDLNHKKYDLQNLDQDLPSADQTLDTTKILEAGALSLKYKNRVVHLHELDLT